MIAHNTAGSQDFGRLEQLVLRETQELYAAVAAAPSGEAAEQMALAWSRRVGRQVLQAGLQARVEAVQRQAARECECQGRRRLHSYRRRTVLTLLGDVRVVRQYLRCAGCGAWSFPADEWLGWQEGFSHPLAEAVAWQAAALPLREARKGLAKFCGVKLSLAAAQQIAARWGAQELRPAPYAERVKGRLVVEIDGAQAHVNGAWHEIKLASCMAWRRGQPGKVSYVAEWLSAEQFAEPLWQEAVVRGAPTATGNRGGRGWGALDLGAGHHHPAAASADSRLVPRL